MKKMLIAGLIVLVIGNIAFWWGRPAYRRHKEEKFMTQTREFLKQKELSKAVLTARQALNVNPRNLEACRIIADLADYSRSPHAMVWRQRIAQIEPTIENEIMLASAALRYEQPPFPLAVKTLAQLEGKVTNNPAYHVVAAELDLKSQRVREAETHFRAAQALEPTNRLHQLNLATIGVQSTDPAKAGAARASLESLQADPELRSHALRALVADSLRVSNVVRAESLSKQLLTSKGAVLTDRLVHLTLLQQVKSPEFQPMLERLQRDVAGKTGEIYDVATWMTTHALAKEAVAWLESLPKTTREQQPLPIAVAYGYIAQTNWTKMESWLRDQKWGEQEYIRLALIARALREQKVSEISRINWQKAVKLASEKTELMTVLLQMAVAWGWTAEAEDLLWGVVRQSPRERWAYQLLVRYYQAKGDTAGLHRVFTVMSHYDAADLTSKNNVAMFSFLLNKDIAQAHQLAREVFEKDQTNYGYVSTYAFSLYLQGKHPDALKTIETLAAPDRERPEVAGYYGLILTANKQTDRARKYLEIAERAPILPEEKQLLATAKGQQ